MQISLVWVCVGVNQQVCVLIVRCAFGGKWRVNVVHFPVYRLCLPFFSHASCNNMHKHSPEWLTSLILSLSLRPSLSSSMPSLAWRSSLPSGLTRTLTKTRAFSLPHSQRSWRPPSSPTWLIYSLCVLKKMLTWSVSGSGYSVCWLTPNQTGKALCVKHVQPHVSY